MKQDPKYQDPTSSRPMPLAPEESTSERGAAMGLQGQAGQATPFPSACRSRADFGLAAKAGGIGGEEVKPQDRTLRMAKHLAHLAGKFDGSPAAALELASFCNHVREVLGERSGVVQGNGPRSSTTPKLTIQEVVSALEHRAAEVERSASMTHPHARADELRYFRSWLARRVQDSEPVSGAGEATERSKPDSELRPSAGNGTVLSVGRDRRRPARQLVEAQ